MSITTVMTWRWRTRIDACMRSPVLRSRTLGLKHLGSEVLRIGVEVPHQPLEIRGFGSGSKGRAAPVVQQCSGEIGGGGGREPLDDQLSPAQARLRAFGIGSRRSKEGIGGPMLLREPGLHCACCKS